MLTTNKWDTVQAIRGNDTQPAIQGFEQASELSRRKHEMLKQLTRVSQQAHQKLECPMADTFDILDNGSAAPTLSAATLKETVAFYNRVNKAIRQIREEAAGIDMDVDAKREDVKKARLAEMQVNTMADKELASAAAANGRKEQKESDALVANRAAQPARSARPGLFSRATRVNMDLSDPALLEMTPTRNPSDFVEPKIESTFASFFRTGSRAPAAGSTTVLPATPRRN